MRRLWAHILLAFTALTLVGTTFATVFTKTESNIEYRDGKELVFRVSEKDDSDAELSEGAGQEIAQAMEERLQTADISRYQIVVEGNDTIKVTLRQETEDDYTKIYQYLSFNGAFALTTSNDDYVLGDDLFTGEDAYVDTINNYPTVIIPINKENEEYKTVVAAAEQLRSDETGGETSTDSEGNETTSYFLYLWHDYEAGYDKYEYATDTSSEFYDEKIASKILMKFNIDNLYLPEDIDKDQNKLAAALNLDTDGDGTASLTEISLAYTNANFYVNLLNASSLNYDVDYLYALPASEWVEETLALGTHISISWSRTFVATLCAILVISLLLVVFYRLGALSVATISIASTFSGIGFIVLIASEFNIAGVVGLCTLALASLVSGVVYLNKLKEEAYRGRSLKKANAEAGKRALLPIIDIHVVLVVIGVFSYVLGGILMRGFAAVTVLGGLASLLLNTLGLRGMMWLAANSTALQNKYEVFGIEKDRVPNLLKEEKQSYFGPYADKDLTKKKKPFGIAALVLLVASIAGIAVFGTINDGVVYNNGKDNINSEIYFETTTDTSVVLLDRDTVNSILEETYVTVDGNEKQLSEYVISFEDGINYYSTTKTEEHVTVYYHYYVVNLNTIIDGDEVTARNGSVNGTLNEVLLGKLADYDGAAAEVKTGKIVSTPQPKFFKIALATLVGIAVSSLYLVLRYRLSRGVTAFLATLATSVITAGLFSLIRINVTSYAVLAVPAIAFFTLMISIILMNREKEMVIEDKSRDNSIENRNKIMVKATSSAFAPILVATILGIYLGINFFGFGPDATAWLFVAIVLGSLVAACLVTVLFGNVSQKFFALFSKVKISNKPKKTKKKVQTRTNKSAEPEEAVFIGIND